MNNQTKKIIAFVLGLIIIALGYVFDIGSNDPAITDNVSVETNAVINTNDINDSTLVIDENGSYTNMEDVSLYLHTFGKLPMNYITKNDASDLGWDSSEGNLWEVTDQMSIGGNRFGNYEGLLPDVEGRQWYECDIDYEGGYRNAKRIVYSNDGLIYYTDDHYESFVQLY